ncbi:MAG: ABC transporter permease subunit [Chloroflexi bacterium]|nr:ABC transporter permease subunit [Chloroflexota bacterium]
MSKALSDDTLKLSQHQASDAEAASEAVYSEAADEIVYDNRTLGRDMLALALLFFVIVTYHLQNPLLKENTQFGSAFRNASLGVAITGGLVICALALIRVHWAAFRSTARLKHPLELGAALILIAYTLYMVLAILFGFNLAGALAGVPQDLFIQRLGKDTPLDLLNSALLLPTILEYVAIVSVVILWQPWSRLAIYRRAIRKQGAALLVAVAALIVWEVLIDALHIEQFLLPKPSVIGATFIDAYPKLVSSGWYTFQNAFWGFVVGCGLGILTGMVSARFVSFSKALLPVAIAINAIPILAFAPIFNNWFGMLNPASKIGIVALTTYFPAMISTVRGLTSVDVLSLELMKSYAATQGEIFRKLRLPSALPFIFSALKVGTTLAMIGAIVSEYFGGSTAGLGFKIRDDAGQFKYPEAWSSIFIAALFGILFYMVVSAVERALMSWHISFREK